MKTSQHYHGMSTSPSNDNQILAVSPHDFGMDTTVTVGEVDDKRQEYEGSVISSQHYHATTSKHVNIVNSSNVNISFDNIKGCISKDGLYRSAKMKHLQDVFVETRAVDKAKQMLKTYGHVTISGAPGEGKTSLALMLCQFYGNTLFVDSIDDFDVDVINRQESNLLIVFDDIFGCVTFSCNLEKLHKLFRKLNNILINMAIKGKEKDTNETKAKPVTVEGSEARVHRLRVVFTSRTYNLNEGWSQLHEFKSSLFRKESILDLTREGLTVDEKAKIIASFRKWNKICDISDETTYRMTHPENNVFGFPLTCMLYFNTPAFQMHTESFFKHPVTCLRGDLDLIVREDSNRSAAIILLVLCGGNFDCVSFQMGAGKDNSTDMFSVVKEIIPTCTRTGIGREIRNFQGTYCTLDCQMASFSHPSIYDAAACAFGNLNIILLLKYCSLRFLFERIRINKSISFQTPEPDDITNMIYIDESLYSLAVSRVVEGVKQGFFNMTLNHSILRDEKIASRLLIEVKEDLPQLIQEKDKETGKCFLYWATLSDSQRLFQEVLDLVGGMIQATFRSSETSDEPLERNINDLYETLVCSVQNNRLACLQSVTTLLQQINKFDANFMTEESKSLLEIASERVHLEAFRFLIQENADPTTTGKERRNCLHVVSESGSKDMAKIILDKSPDLIDVSDDKGRTPAMICAETGHIQLLRFLVLRGANLDITDPSALNCLHVASMEGHVSVVKYLVSLKKSSLGVNRRDGLFNQTPVMMAVEGGHYEIYKELVAEEADVKLTDYNDKDCLMFACESGNLLIVKHLLSLKLFDINKTGGFSEKTPVMFAAEGGHYDIFRLLASKGADLSRTDKYNRDCLLWACAGGSLSIVKHILSLKTFDINRRSGLYNNTPVSMAACRGHYGVFSFLVSEGADLSLNDKYDRDCLILACVGGNFSVVKRLLSIRTCDINRKAGFYNRSPVMVAAHCGHCDVFDLLVSKGADLSLRDAQDRDCLMWACVGGNMSIIRYLLSLKIFDINRKVGPYKETPSIMAASRGHHRVCSLIAWEGAKGKV